MDKNDFEYLNKYMEWEAYYAPKFKALFGIDMPTDTYGINILGIPDKIKFDIIKMNIDDLKRCLNDIRYEDLEKLKDITWKIMN